MAMNPKRATGANVKLRGRFEADYGVQAVGNYVSLAAYSWGLSLRQPLENDPLLGAGRDPLAPARGAIDVLGTASVPVDRRLIGYWLKGLLAAPSASTQVGARGFISFPANPSDTQTITLDGTTWTFVAGAPGAGETQIGADLAATLAQLVIDLNASADANLTPATYSTYGDRLVIEHDTADASGDAYTLATNISGAKLSAATLRGGGLYRHSFASAAPALPSLSAEVEHGDLEGGSNRFIVQTGILVNTLTIERGRSGAAKASLDLIAQGETQVPASVAGAPLDIAVALFNQFNGYILVDGVRAANLSAGSFRVTNNLDVVGGLRDDGLIEGADPGETGVALSVTGRFSNTAIKAAAEAETPVEIRFGFRDSLTGAELEFRAHEVHLPKPSREIQGPGGIEVTYESIGAKDIGAGKALDVTLWNDRVNYDNPA